MSPTRNEHRRREASGGQLACRCSLAFLGDRHEYVIGAQQGWDPDHDPAGGKLERRAIQLRTPVEDVYSPADPSVCAAVDLDAG
jgi:hypothetical protein